MFFRRRLIENYNQVDPHICRLYIRGISVQLEHPRQGRASAETDVYCKTQGLLQFLLQREPNRSEVGRLTLSTTSSRTA